MSNIHEENSNKNKGKINLTFIKYQTWAFIISGILAIIAVSSAYLVYIEGAMAQIHAEQSLKEFELLIQNNETSIPENIIITQIINTEETKEAEDKEDTVIMNNLESEKYNKDVQQVVVKAQDKPEIEYTLIAKLQVDKINLHLAVLSEWSSDLLDISVNKFQGPEPNEQGNFIVIGHSYLGGAHFGNLHMLEIGDELELTDLTGRKLTYEVYEILIIHPEEVEKLNTNKAQTLTLVTCDKDDMLRLVIKSEEKNSI